MDERFSDISRETAVQPPGWLGDGLERIETDPRIDQVAKPLEIAAEAVTANGRGAVLRGDWLGHALHPLLTDVPLGCWLAAGVLDLVAGRRSQRAAQHLVGVGLLAVPFTSAAGLADWQQITDTAPRRVGVVHAVGNGAVVVCYFASWNARRKGHHARGRLWGFAGGGLAVATGYLGGHLAFGRSVGQGTRGFPEAEQPQERPAEEEPVIVDIGEAAQMLDIPVSQVWTLIDDELLTPVEGVPGPPSFLAADVRAVRLVGG